MNNESFVIALKKGMPFSRRFVMTAKAPPMVPLTISGGTPGATVSIDNAPLGTLDDQGNFAYSGVAPGTHEIQLSKPGYSSRTFYGQPFVAGKAFDLSGDKQLSLEAGYVRISVAPTLAVVSYKRTGEANRHLVLDLTKTLTLPPGMYEFAAEEPNYLSKIAEVKIQANQTASVPLVLQPVSAHVATQEVVNTDEVIKKNGEWYHGRTDKYIRLRTSYDTNTILFSKEFKVKKMSWQVNLGGSSITYKLDGKGVSITRNIDGVETTEKVKGDFSSRGNPSACYAATIKLESNDVILSRQDGTRLNTVHDEKHDWSQARIFAKGDTYFSFLPGR